MPITWIRVALLNLLLAGILGVFMRYAFVSEVEWMNFRNVMHGHSHVAMLGWIYLALFTLISHVFLKNPVKKVYRILFWMTQICVIGMLISFPIHGYGLFSIVFSTLHVFLSYAFSIYFIKDIWSNLKGKISKLFVITSLIWMVLSTFALFLVAFFLASGMTDMALYHGAIQFFLHFQFNGWFIFAVIGLIFRLLEVEGIPFSIKQARAFYYLLVISCILTYLLAVTWSTPLKILFWINSLGVAIQLVAGIFFIAIIWKIKTQIRASLKRWPFNLLCIAFLAFCAKILIQAAVIIPYLATVAYTIRNYVIGFIHLILLAGISSVILGLASRLKWIDINKVVPKTGLLIFLGGILLTELMLFLQGTMFWGGVGFLPYYYELLTIFSVLIPLGVLIILGSQRQIRR